MQLQPRNPKRKRRKNNQIASSSQGITGERSAIAAFDLGDFGIGHRHIASSKIDCFGDKLLNACTAVADWLKVDLYFWMATIVFLEPKLV